MATAVTSANIIPSKDPYLTYKIDDATDRDGDIYTFPIYQNYIKVVNEGDFSLHLNVGRYNNITIHPGNSFEAYTDFLQFDVKINAGAADECDFIAITKELGNTPVITIQELWKYLVERSKAGEGDIVITGSNATTSAGTANAAIEGDAGKYEVEHTFTLKNTAGSTTHKWFSGVMPVSIDVTSTAGIAVPESNYITFIQGVGKVKVIMTGEWKSADIIKIKVHGVSIMGFGVNDKEITNTLEQ